MIGMEDFVEKVECVDGHWLWTNQPNKNGYGTCWYEGRVQLVHRVAYQIFVGPLTTEDVVHHGCDIRLCVRPMCLKKTDHWGNMEARRGKGYDFNGTSEEVKERNRVQVFKTRERDQAEWDAADENWAEYVRRRNARRR